MGNRTGVMGLAVGMAAVVAASVITVATVPSAVAAPVVIPKPLPSTSGPAYAVNQVTGLGDTNDTPGRFSILGTDLGITWDNGSGEILAAFGDTAHFDGESLLYGSMYHWRSNVLLRSADRNLRDGMSISGAALRSPGYAKRLLEPDLRHEITLIPTAGAEINGKQYMTYMSVKSWGLPNYWQTNYAGIAESTDNGQNWTRLDAIRPNTGGNQKFQMGALLKSGGMVYVYGTPAGRQGDVYLARVPEQQFTALAAYQYFSNGNWVPGNPDAATPVIGAPNGELSVAYNNYLGKYIALLSDDGTVMRTSDTPEGPWSAPRLIVNENDVPTSYAPYIHPWSSGDTLYFTLSISSIYNVVLMRLPLDSVR
nr:DUF4185 domain-containing protein [Nocardia sp. 348MFTsu5.1]